MNKLSPTLLIKSLKMRASTSSLVLCLSCVVPFFLFTASIAGGGETLKPLAGGKEYSSVMGRYMISFPQSWTINPGDRGLVTGWSKPEKGATVGASVTVFPGALDSPMNAAELMTRYLAGMKEDGFKDGFKKTEEHHGKVNGRDAVWVVVDINSNGVLRRGLVLGTTEGKTAYILTCSTLPEKFDSVRPTFEGICGTFKVTK